MKTAIIAMEEKKAFRIALYQMEKNTSICDQQLVCSAYNEKHVNAIAMYIKQSIQKEYAIQPNTIQGCQVGQWVLMDYSTNLIHIFLDSIREYYHIEDLWSEEQI